MKKRLIFVVVLLSAGIIFAGTKPEGELTWDFIRQVQKSVNADASVRAWTNAVTNSNVKQLTLNREIVTGHNETFSLRLKTEGITNQKISGRCWMFAGFNILRPAVIKKYNLAEFEFSENYLMFWDKFEKANAFLEMMIETAKRDIDDREVQALLTAPIPDGGWWNYYVALMEKYGSVPKEMMPETMNSEKTDYMNKTLDRLACRVAVELRAMSAQGKKIEELRKYKDESLKQFYRLLVIHLGNPPEQFIWRVKDKNEKLIEMTCTPQGFYKETVAVDLKSYYTLCDYPARPANKHYSLNFSRNLYDQPDMDFVNVPAERMKELAFTMIQDSLPVYFAADVSWDMDKDYGIMEEKLFDYESLFNIDLKIGKKERFQYRLSTPNHAMAFIGADIQNGKPAKWLVENSWGKDIGKDGLWTMYDKWFDEYVFVVIVPEKYLPEDLKVILKTKPESIPAWDTMRSAFTK
ncbi:MAG: C1 family peptidase [Candidatus Marinimicrobia bacterium]|nr:C1 family peptidase [Candidatus Neomarinimicrobiota bacterium]